VTEFFQGLLLGVVQGIAEWLPISSEGINTLILTYFYDEQTREAIAESIWLHLGTVCAALTYFRREVADLLRHVPQYVRQLGTGENSERSSLITFLIVATALTGAVGAPLMLIELSEESVPAGIVMAVIGAFLIVTGLVQRLARRVSGTRTTLGVRDAVLVGVVQAFAAFPGLSRSGLTVSALLLRGYVAKQAMRVSFLMSIPAVLGAVIGLALLGEASFDVVAVSGILTAFVFGLASIGLLMKVATRIPFWQFCLVLGALSFLPLLIDAV
jgi:undecaprenyl-diphosphatase